MMMMLIDYKTVQEGKGDHANPLANLTEQTQPSHHKPNGVDDYD
jgi:hypothetical protein